MGNTAKAFLGTEGKVDYRKCEVCYYTYTMSNKPNKFGIIVNVTLKHDKNDYTVTLALDKTFSSEDEAIKFGVAQGEKFIDRAYKEGRKGL